MGSRVVGFLVLASGVIGGAVCGHADASPAAAVYETQRMPDGAMQFSGSAPGVAFHRFSYGDGHFRFQIAAGTDIVDIEVTAGVVRAVRGNRSVTLTAGRAGASDLAKVRTLLAGSQAIQRYEALADEAAVRQDRGAAGYGVRLGKSTLAWLLGDRAAPARLAQLAAAHQAITADSTRSGGAKQFRLTRMSDCWGTYEQEVTSAQNDLFSCYVGASQSFWQAAYMSGCDFEWTIRVEGNWFEYLSCSAVPLRAS